MGYGGYHPYPRRFGGGRPLLRLVHDSLASGRGSALDATNSSTVAWVETMAHARAICFDGYGTSRRLAMQWDPARTTDMMGRWETIFGVPRAPGTTDYDRRQTLVRRWRRFLDAPALHSRIVSRLTLEVGEVFHAVEYISYANAVIHVPDLSYPWGDEATGLPWYSTTAHILVLLTKPDGYSEATFYEAASKVGPALDGVIPSWCTFDWYRAPAAGPSIDVAGGPSAGGFYLDDEHNLDNSVFDA